MAQMLTCMDDLNAMADADREEQAGGGGEGGGRGEAGEEAEESQGLRAPRHVVVIGATNRPDSLDPALRRAGELLFGGLRLSFAGH